MEPTPTRRVWPFAVAFAVSLVLLLSPGSGSPPPFPGADKIVHVWAPLTVAEHLTLAARPGSWTVPKILDLLPRLAERRGQLAGQLSGGEQQMLAVARALLINPRLVLLDEPSDGLAPAIVDQIAEVVATMRGEGVAVLLVEQDLHLAFAVSDEIACMERGRIVHRVPTPEFRRDPETAHRLLGVT